jgi:hypothetical protein
MQYLNTNNFKNTLMWFGAGFGTLVPGYTFFTSYPPPIFPGISILTACLSAAIIVIAFAFNPQPPSREKHTNYMIRRASFLLLISFICLTIYVLLLRYCTVLEPQDYSQRFQVGLWKYDWSLTEVGRSLKQNSPLSPIEDWMMKEGGFREGGPEIIWRTWSVITAGCLLLFSYMSGFTFWTIGFCLLARQKIGLKGIKSPLGSCEYSKQKKRNKQRGYNMNRKALY